MVRPTWESPRREHMAKSARAGACRERRVACGVYRVRSGPAAGVAARSARHGAAVTARMCARSEAVELEVLGAEGGEPRVPPRPLRLSLLELLGKLVRRDQPAPSHRRARHNHRFRTFVSCENERRIKANNREYNAQFRYAVS
uniref:SFRICE_023716 n=1 Tax=Spodoptera frugiperda TaxID=7108 RepID=A0A2H1VZX1_SPOFR